MSFLVDAEMLDDYRDLTADDMGAYRSHGSPHKYVHATFEDNRVKHLACNRKTGDDKCSCLHFVKKVWKMQGIPRFKKNDRTTSSG